MQRRINELFGRIDVLARAQLRPDEHRPNPCEPHRKTLTLCVAGKLKDPKAHSNDIPPETQTAHEQPQLREHDRPERAPEHDVEQRRRRAFQRRLPACDERVALPPLRGARGTSEAIEEQRRGGRDARRNGEPHQAVGDLTARPMESVESERMPHRRAGRRADLHRIRPRVRIDPHDRRPDLSHDEVAPEHVPPPCGAHVRLKTPGQIERPRKKIHRVAEAAAQPRNHLEEHRNRADHRDRRQHRERERSGDRSQIERRIFAAHELHRDRREEQNGGHREEHEKVAQHFPERVVETINRRGCDDLSYPRRAVALYRALHEIEAEEGEQHRREQRAARADPS